MSKGIFNRVYFSTGAQPRIFIMRNFLGIWLQFGTLRISIRTFIFNNTVDRVYINKYL